MPLAARPGPLSRAVKLSVAHCHTGPVPINLSPAEWSLVAPLMAGCTQGNACSAQGMAPASVPTVGDQYCQYIFIGSQKLAGATWW